jgi:hypothetical protein
MKKEPINFKIQSLAIGDYIWTVCGLAPIVEITKTGYSDFLGGYCYGKARFSKDSTITFGLVQTKTTYKDGYLCHKDELQFIEKCNVSDFLETQC